MLLDAKGKGSALLRRLDCRNSKLLLMTSVETGGGTTVGWGWFVGAAAVGGVGARSCGFCCAVGLGTGLVDGSGGDL